MLTQKVNKNNHRKKHQNSNSKQDLELQKYVSIIVEDSN